LWKIVNKKERNNIFISDFREYLMTQKICAECGTKMDYSAEECPECESPQSMAQLPRAKSWQALVVMCVLVGFLGIHRFYVGKIGTGVLMLFTLGGFGVWVLYDFVKILMSLFTDKRGNRIVYA
jgi:TM2 domain-containing membrane protein YozV/ribosomal protein L40E